MSIENRAQTMSKNLSRKQAGEFYDTFFTEGGKNMPRKEFIRQLTGLADAKNMQTDLAQIQDEKATRLQMQQQNCGVINRAIRKTFS